MSLLSDLEAADASGDAIAYYNVLSAAGDSYGALALGGAPTSSGSAELTSSTTRKPAFVDSRDEGWQTVFGR